MNKIPLNKWFKVVDIKHGLIYTTPYKEAVTEGDITLDYFYYCCRSAITLNMFTFYLLPDKELKKANTIDLLYKANLIESLFNNGMKPYEIIDFVLL